MTSNLNAQTVRSQFVTTSTTFDPLQTFVSRTQQKPLLDSGRLNFNGFANTRRFQSNYQTNTNKVLDMQIYRPSSLYINNYGTSNNLLKQQKQFFDHYSHKPYGAQPINYHPPVKPYYENQFWKYSRLHGKDDNKSGFNPTYGLNQYKKTGFQYNRNTVPPPTQIKTNNVFNNQSQYRKNIVHIGPYSNFRNQRYIYSGKDNNQTYGKAVHQKVQVINQSSKVELIHSKYEQLNNKDQKIVPASKTNQYQQNNQYDFRPLSPEDKWRQDQKKLAKMRKQVKTNKYNIYSCLDQPYNKCLTEGYSDWSCPSNQVCAAQDYYYRQWN